MLPSIIKSGERTSVQQEFYHNEDGELAPLSRKWLLRLFGIASLSKEEADKQLQPYVHYDAIKETKSPLICRHRSMFGHPVSCNQVGLNKTDPKGTLYYHPKKADWYSASCKEAQKINPINLPPNTLARFELLQQHPVGGLLCVVPAACWLVGPLVAHLGRSVRVGRVLAFACLQLWEMASLVEEFEECQLTE